MTDLYPGNAHFIYELLQNAEDAGARRVTFTLTERAIEFEHDGRRLFNEHDVDGITGIGVSTKRDDPTAIGKFGAGFKAVFAYTDTPEIHSGEYHFRIRDLIVPEVDGVVPTALDEQVTRFAFPFDNPAKRPAAACAEIEKSLRAIDASTLLFLNKIEKIEYMLPGGGMGVVERQFVEANHVQISVQLPSGEARTSHWLRFADQVDITDEQQGPVPCRIAIAFQLEHSDAASGKDSKRPEWRIVPVERGDVCIYFPAEKETSNLKFHLHAPFASTVARDSVRDCESNNALRDALSSLFVKSLTVIRDDGMLTIEFLAALPNAEDALSGFYEPIRQCIVDAFRNQPLTPTRRGSHAPATSLCRGPAAIANVISDYDLSLLTELEPPLWAANAAQQNQREDRFLESLEMRRWGWEDLAKTFYLIGGRDGSRTEIVEGWIAKKPDEQLLRLYALIGEGMQRPHAGFFYVGDAKIVRVGVGDVVAHVAPKNAYLIEDDAVRAPSDIHVVRPEVYRNGRASKQQKDQAKVCLGRFGVRPYDERAIVECRLEGYRPGDYPTVGDAYFSDVKSFIHYWKRHRDETEMFRGVAFLLGAGNDGKLYWRTPKRLFMDVPYRATGLHDVADILKSDPISNKYVESLPKAIHRNFAEFLVAIGCMTELSVVEVGVKDSPHAKELTRNWFNSRLTSSAIDEDYTTPNLEEYLKCQRRVASALVWGAVIRAPDDSAVARFGPNQQHQPRTEESQLVYHLKRYAWIPDKSGVFHKPEDITQDQLPKEFPCDDRNGLLTAIGFGEVARKRDVQHQVREQVAQDVGFASQEEMDGFSSLASECRVVGISVREARSRLGVGGVSPPTGAAANPDRRSAKATAKALSAVTREGVRRERTIQSGLREEVYEGKAYLRGMYTNRDDLLVCQCCHAEMPFKMSPGEYYFEAVQCVRGLQRHHPENRLALCPTCSAKYRHARETNDATVRQAIVANPSSPDAEAVEVPIRLAGCDYELHFVGKHWIDLKGVLEADRGCT